MDEVKQSQIRGQRFATGGGGGMAVIRPQPWIHAVGLYLYVSPVDQQRPQDPNVFSPRCQNLDGRSHTSSSPNGTFFFCNPGLMRAMACRSHHWACSLFKIVSLAHTFKLCCGAHTYLQTMLLSTYLQALLGTNLQTTSLEADTPVVAEQMMVSQHPLLSLPCLPAQ